MESCLYIRSDESVDIILQKISFETGETIHRDNGKKSSSKESQASNQPRCSVFLTYSCCGV